MGKNFHMEQRILFKHCDPAGIVFFPRYFEMMNDCIEAFFDDVLGVPFHKLLVTNGVPTVQIETRFLAPSRHGDLLDIFLRTTKVGRTSWQYAMKATCEGEDRFATTATLVHIDGNGKPCLWPVDLARKLSEYEASDDT